MYQIHTSYIEYTLEFIRLSLVLWCIWFAPYVCICMCVYIYIYICIYIYIYAYIHTCMCVCINALVCL